ncbi:MAG TPA: hypothetical protein VMF09_09420 [Solirubrobacteraceae bacterium]|nr:hypothetical protein [Solirubrobacteraceae bacterium]
MLAATERAERHHRGPVDGVTLGEVIEHLGFARVGWTTRSLRPQIETFLAAGVLVPFRRFGFDFLKLSTNGRRRLARARRADPIVLPESPQYRAWRHARQQAMEQVGAMRQLFRETLDEADRLLTDEQTDSDAWYALAPRVFMACNQLASVTHCLREWPEPDDAHDTLPTRGDRRIGRRVVGFWKDAHELDALYPRHHPAQG